MASTKHALRYALIVAGTLALAACGGGDDEADGTGSSGYDYTPPAGGAQQQQSNNGVQQQNLGPNGMGQPTQQGLALEAGDTVFFGYDQYNLSAQAQATLRAQAMWLRKFSNVSVTIEGHCDERGTREYNLALGDRRANAVKDYLVAQGVSPSRVATISYGKERPLAVCSSEACWSKNRRGATIVNAF